MLIRYWMSKPVIAIDKAESMQQAINLMKEKRIGRLPVIHKGSLCGIVTDRDLKRAMQRAIRAQRDRLAHLERRGAEMRQERSHQPVTIRP